MWIEFVDILPTNLTFPPYERIYIESNTVADALLLFYAKFGIDVIATYKDKKINFVMFTGHDIDKLTESRRKINGNMLTVFEYFALPNIKVLYKEHVIHGARNISFEL